MSSEILTTLSAGIISGIVASFIIFIFIKYWRNVIVPWYEDKVYKDIKIDGNWETCGEEKEEIFHEIATVKQRAHRVWGNITYKTKNEFNEYEFEGEFKNLILTARYWVKKENNLDRGTFTLMARNNGRTLKGYYAWYLDEDNDVINGSYEWTKC